MSLIIAKTLLDLRLSIVVANSTLYSLMKSHPELHSKFSAPTRWVDFSWIPYLLGDNWRLLGDYLCIRRQL